ncbi:probable alpha-aspartyl dipeptidase isoform X2 [Teleopsis dalmanni]|uniref:probable alpha-aspartyl dipeptidase isoform X2 n=1 Tax=Teleopsis dalmanni TaxID=139649 RepID=UPI0018CFA2DE|nr:probable alpha-aspartyl dipeptidase isoform X2 [Teleopsis dalmanni]
MSVPNILLLSSSRVHGYGFLEYSKDLILDFLANKVRTILFVPYAQKDHDKYTATVQTAVKPWGLNVEGLHTKTDLASAIRGAEAIFIGGGNTFVLLNKLYEENLVDVIRNQVLKKGTPYIGSSAGTNVATRSIHTTNDMPICYPPTFDGLKLVPFNINPHYIESEHKEHMGETRDERIKEYLLYSKYSVLGLREGSSVLVHGNKAFLNGKAKLFTDRFEALELHDNTDLTFLLNENK